MIGDPVCLVKCDGPASLPIACGSSRVVAAMWGNTREHVAAFFNALHRDWLADRDRVRCPACLAIDGVSREGVA